MRLLLKLVVSLKIQLKAIFGSSEKIILSAAVEWYAPKLDKENCVHILQDKI